ncbi:FAD-dependent oxidoreductase [Anaerospora hongkongensis]|uniref:FAD-dependent oxidoreductase n=1 Tax=Anaerospora hongkongensis TaxID=244830 RepID=UPI00289A5BD8|nr:FAD-dependent oxidoreductase [Anaerospora hongkongensis]
MERKKLEYDVVVVGGGAAGIAAAVGAAQSGARTLVLERNPYLGGQATHANVYSYCGFFTPTDEPKQVVRGVGDQVLEYLRKLGKYDKPVRSPMGNWIILLDPEALKYALDLVMEDAKAQFLTDVHVIGAKRDGDTISELECMDDSGRFFVQASVFVDASGEANLSALAGGLTAYGDKNGDVQAATMSLRIGGVAPDATISLKLIGEAIKKAREAGLGPFTKNSGMTFRVPGVETEVNSILPSVKVNGLDAFDLTRAGIYIRKQIQAYMQALKSYLPGFENAYLIQSGPRLGIRETRRIIGDYILTVEDVLAVRRFDDSIACCPWPMEIHRREDQMAEYTHLSGNSYFHIPLGALKANNTANLWGAGRTISCDHEAFGSVRVMGTGFATGHAAGVAAALSIGKFGYDTKQIQAELVRQNAIIK